MYKQLANGLPTRKMMKLREPHNPKYENDKCITCHNKRETHNHIFTKCPDGKQAKRQAELDIRNIMQNKRKESYVGNLWFGETFNNSWGITEKEGNRGITPKEVRNKFGKTTAEK